MVEYAQYGDLLGYLRNSRGVRDNYYSDPSVKPRTSLTSKQLIRFAWQISDGMDYLSKKKVISSLAVVYLYVKSTLEQTESSSYSVAYSLLKML